MYFARIAKNTSKWSDICSFLAENTLRVDEHITHFVVALDDNDQLLACGGLAGNTIKSVAISAEMRGTGIALQLATELVNLAHEQGQYELFIYTKPEYARLFQDCGFYPIAEALPHIVLLENSRTRLQKQCAKWQQMKVAGEKIGAIVMNANPFTLGHRYLVEQALSQCDHLHLFVVGEDASQFSYNDRFRLIQQGLSDLSHITIHSGSNYIISRATFPDYFLKDKGLVNSLHLELDLKLFRQSIAPSLGITHRFVGTEPICEVTNEYNRQMHYWLFEAEMEASKIQVVEIERKTFGNEPISASRVRDLLKQQDWQSLEQLVPATTLTFLQQIETK